MTTERRWFGLLLVLIGGLWPARSLGDAPIGNVWGSNSLTKVMRSAVPGAAAGVPLHLTGAGGEVVSGQAVFRPGRDLAAARASITDLRHRTTDAAIPAQAVTLQWVRFIDINRNSRGIPVDELVAKAPASIPDPFWQGSAVRVVAGAAQPLWIEIGVPEDAAAGDYEATLTIGAGNDTVKLPVTLHVWNFTVPATRHVSVINWWSFPGVGFKNIRPFTSAYWDLLRRFCRFLVAHRQTDVSASIGLIRESGDQAHGFAYDTSRLERFAEVAFQAGVHRVHLHAAGRRLTGRAGQPGDVGPHEPNLRRLAAWEKVVRHRGWKNRFLVSISDEPFIYQEDSYPAVVDRVHRVAPDIRCIEAVETEYLGDLDIYVPKLSHLNLWYPRFRELQRNGREVWFYTCCHPVGRYPNRFLDQSLLKVRILHWINYRYGLDGYLHWGLNQFASSDPFTQAAISKGLPLGDRAIVYPGTAGPVGSLRFSAMRDGLQDFEYLWVLEHELAAIKERFGAKAFWLDPRQRPLELCRRVIRSFHNYTRDPDALFKTRRAIAEQIEALRSDPLLVVQTSPPEGTVVPAGPRVINVRGLAPPGASITVNGKPVTKIRPDGSFVQAYFMRAAEPTITIAVEHQRKKQTTTRTFIAGD